MYPLTISGRGSEKRVKIVIISCSAYILILIKKKNSTKLLSNQIIEFLAVIYFQSCLQNKRHVLYPHSKHRRRWSNIVYMLYKCFVFTGQATSSRPRHNRLCYKPVYSCSILIGFTGVNTMGVQMVVVLLYLT